MSRDVVFSEQVFPFVSSPTQSEEDEAESLWAPLLACPIQDDLLVCGPEVQRPINFEIGSSSEASASPSSPIIPDNNNIDCTPEIDTETSIESTSSHVPEDSSPKSTEPVQAFVSHTTVPETAIAGVVEPLLGKGHRQKIASVKLQGFIMNQPARKPKDEVSNYVRSTSAEVIYPIQAHDDSHRFLEQHIVYVAAIISHLEPTYFKKAMEDERWQQAIGSGVWCFR